jgi:arginyl-tRNA synthetase
MKDYLNNRVSQALKKLGYENYPLTFERPKEDKFGDLSSNIAMIIGKAIKSNPREIANQIINNLGLPDKYISKAEIAGGGFINFFIADKFYKEELVNILKRGANYGRIESGGRKSANIEWVSANPTGPLHAGHGRHIALGKAIASLLEWSGYNVTREYYYNDAGRQMETLAKSVYARYRQLFEPEFKMPDEAYLGEYVLEIARQIKDEYGNKLVKSENDLSVFKTAGENWCFKSIRQTLNRLGIVHDRFFSEVSLYEDGKIKKILQDFKNNDLSYEKASAVWLRLNNLKDSNGRKMFDEDKVIVKSTGEPTYRLPDMAYHIDKIDRGYDLIVDIFGSDHSDTYKEVLAGVSALGYDISKIKVIIHQMVTFVQEGKPVKMSKRSDNVYYLDDLLDDVGVDVAQFFFVMRGANTHLDFDINLAREQSEKNPVFYLQYAHARICSILRYVDTVFPEYSEFKGDFNFEKLDGPDEISLCGVLSYFPDTVQNAALTFEPHKIITYLNEVAENYHKFYHNNRVVNAGDKEVSYRRLKLCEAAKIVLKNGLDIIGISAPERM